MSSIAPFATSGDVFGIGHSAHAGSAQAAVPARSQTDVAAHDEAVLHCVHPLGLKEQD